MKQTLFVTGTDTDAGKTIVSCGLLARAKLDGLTTAAIKPIASGCEQTDEGLRNSDALALQAAVTMTLPYEQINPVALEPAIAPHIALQESQRRVSAEQLAGYCRGVMMKGADFTLIEGAGGWRVPLSPREMYSSVPKKLEVPVILVVGMKLGCINHAVLTAEAIFKDGLKLAGWVANRAEADMSRFEENLTALKGLMPAPCLGVVPHLDEPTPENVASYLTLPKF
ncbi:dethiobiotin synthase [Parendozoicomonas haliclonae]|uniref:ATP-dependent dethiobiotin synthetase BioD n=1 Tax=Parendozoicomonas haliclonae TaxID=1960125 RepID=A0A1X7AIN7_9GAMM|nr:dethiobiotin synthase [Parendozoicomonas haliclonae]SMA45291.1 ATP-dependent dethiobiotin synthetase BioD 1 [Parendozoicomonas haliclonae]